MPKSYGKGSGASGVTAGTTTSTGTTLTYLKTVAGVVQSSVATESAGGTINIPDGQAYQINGSAAVISSAGTGTTTFGGGTARTDISATSNVYIKMGATLKALFTTTLLLIDTATQLVWGTAGVDSGDVGIKRVAAGVLGVTNASVSLGFIQDVGMLRVAADVLNDSAVFADITGFSLSLAAGRSYGFHAMLPVTTGATLEGVKIDLAGTATVTSLTADIAIKSHAATPVFTLGRLTALGGGVGVGQTVAGAGNASVEISGLITVNLAGTFKLQFAKNADTGVANTAINRGSWLRVWDTP